MSTFTKLVDDIEKWSHRDELRPLIPEFIALAEYAMFDNDVEPLLIREQEVSATTTTSGKVIALPDTFERMRAISITLDSGNHDLNYQSPQQLVKKSGTGLPCFYTLVGTDIEFDITPDNDYTIELQYFSRIPKLTADAPTNDILTNHYNIYLFGALSELFSHVLDTEQEQRYTAKFIAAVKGANKANKKSRYGVAPAMTFQGVTP